MAKLQSIRDTNQFLILLPYRYESEESAHAPKHESWVLTNLKLHSPLHSHETSESFLSLGDLNELLNGIDQIVTGKAPEFRLNPLEPFFGLGFRVRNLGRVETEVLYQESHEGKCQRFVLEVSLNALKEFGGQLRVELSRIKPPARLP